MKDSSGASIDAAVSTLGLALPCQAREKLTAYLALLAKWNATYNLTAIRDINEMVSHHLLDSLSIARYIKPGRLLDVGSGGGLPGVPLAIWGESCLPGLHVTVLDANHKKAAFLRQVKIDLTLANLEVCGERVESWKPEQRYDQIVSRAFSDLSEFFQLTRHLGAPRIAGGAEGARWLAMKGVHPHEEIHNLAPPCVLEQVARLKVPGLDAERHLVVMRAADA